MSDFDVIVVGGGPAGASAAYHASRDGLRVLIVDRHDFPRTKACGDALSPRALAAVARMGVDSLPGVPVHGMRMIHAPTNRHHFEAFSDHEFPHMGRVVSRRDLDALLLQKAIDAGAEFKVAMARRRLEYDGRITGVELETAAGALTVTARNVIGATGSGGARRFLALGRDVPSRVWGTACRTYARLEAAFTNELEVHVPIATAESLHWGYGWIFPSANDCVNVGVGVAGSQRAAVALAPLLDRFLATLRATDPRFSSVVRCDETLSAPIAIGSHESRRTGFLASGDLAGVANPFSGEGIALALETGELAARAIAEHPDDPALAYQKALSQLVPRHDRIRPALRSLYERPNLTLARGGDIVLGVATPSGRAVRGLLWDLRPTKVSRASCEDSPHVSELARNVRQHVLRAVSSRPLLLELIRHLLNEPRICFGWYSSLVGILAEAAGRLPAAEGLVSALAIVEIVNLVDRMQADLPNPTAPADESTWGRTTLIVLLADVLTARALTMLHSSSPTIVRQVLDATRGTFRPRTTALTPPHSSAPLLRLACALGAGHMEADSLLPAGLQRIAHDLEPAFLSGTVTELPPVADKVDDAAFQPWGSVISRFRSRHVTGPSELRP